MEPNLPGAELDLAQALALEGDRASAAAMLRDVGDRADLSPALRTALGLQIAALDGRLPDASQIPQGTWQHRVQLTTLGGYDSNLNNAPAHGEITLTFPEGNVTLPLDPASRPASGAALMASALWQGIRAHGDSLLVMQGELRARATGQAQTNFQQIDLAAAWLEAPNAATQWVGRIAATDLRFGNETLLQAGRVTLQRQFAAVNGDMGCRPAVAAELEHRRFPSSRTLDGNYAGMSVGLFCRPAATSGHTSVVSYMNAELRIGADKPVDGQRVGGTYERAEVRLQGERRLLDKGRVGIQWSSAYQWDAEPYSPLLGNIPRRTMRHLVQVEAVWPVAKRWSLVGTLDASVQRSNIAAFESRQRSVYLGLRWD